VHIRLIRRDGEPVAMKKVKYIDHPFLEKQINGIAQAFCQRDHMQLAAFFKPVLLDQVFEMTMNHYPAQTELSPDIFDSSFFLPFNVV